MATRTTLSRSNCSQAVREVMIGRDGVRRVIAPADDLGERRQPASQDSEAP